MKQLLSTLILSLTCLLAGAQAKKIIILSPQVSVEMPNRMAKNWNDTLMSSLKARLARAYQTQAAQRFTQVRNRARWRNKNIQIITLAPNDAVPVGSDIAFVIAPTVQHTIYMSPQDAMAINTGVQMMNWNSPMWMPYVRPSSSGVLTTAYQGNSRNVYWAGGYLTNNRIKQMFKMMD
jgi:hypothetical protein